MNLVMYVLMSMVIIKCKTLKILRFNLYFMLRFKD